MGEWEPGGEDAGAGVVGSSGYKAVEGGEGGKEQQRSLPEERESSAARAMGGGGQERGEAGATRGED